jgi:hypothetical protein
VVRALVGTQKDLSTPAQLSHQVWQALDGRGMVPARAVPSARGDRCDMANEVLGFRAKAAPAEGRADRKRSSEDAATRPEQPAHQAGDGSL